MVFFFSHCQVPCGIYDDDLRVKQMQENVDTIRKSVSQIQKLEAESIHDSKKIHQLSRWISTKEQHASRIIDTISNYFLTQRVKKPVNESFTVKNKKIKESKYYMYLKTLEDHHLVIVSAMKVKQNSTMEFIQQLQDAVDQFATHYEHDKK